MKDILKSETARKSILLSLLSVAFSSLTLLLSVVTANYFGATRFFDAYLAGAALPFTITGLLLGGIAYVLLPLQRTWGEQSASDCLAGLIVADVLIILIGILSSRPLIVHLAPSLNPTHRELAILIERIYWVAVGLSTISAFCSAVYQQQRQFFRPAVAILFHPLMSIAAACLLSRQLGVLSLAAGYLAGSFIQLAILLAHLPQGSRLFRIQFTTRSWIFLRRLAVVILSLLPNTLVPAIDAFWGISLAAGSLTYANYGYRISAAIASVVVNGFATVVFPNVVDQAHDADHHRILVLIRRTLIASYAFGLPIILLSRPVLEWPIRLLLQHGHFLPSDTARLTQLAPYYLIGMLGMSSMNILGRVLYAYKRFSTTTALGIVFIVVYFALDGVLTKRWTYMGFGAAYAVCWTGMVIATSIILLFTLRRNVAKLVESAV